MLQLSYTEKGIRRMAELLKAYQAALFDDEVVDCFKVTSWMQLSTAEDCLQDSRRPQGLSSGVTDVAC